MRCVAGAGPSTHVCDQIDAGAVGYPDGYRVGRMGSGEHQVNNGRGIEKRKCDCLRKGPSLTHYGICIVMNLMIVWISKHLHVY